jgi:hypothetical protein
MNYGYVMPCVGNLTDEESRVRSVLSRDGLETGFGLLIGIYTRNYK